MDAAMLATRKTEVSMRQTQVRSLDDIPAGRRIWLYGAGSLGQHIYDALGSERVAGFIDRQADRRIEDRPVLNLETYSAQREADDLIVIASSYSREIRRELAGA